MQPNLARETHQRVIRLPIKKPIEPSYESGNTVDETKITRGINNKPHHDYCSSHLYSSYSCYCDLRLFHSSHHHQSPPPNLWKEHYDPLPTDVNKDQDNYSEPSYQTCYPFSSLHRSSSSSGKNITEPAIPERQPSLRPKHRR